MIVIEEKVQQNVVEEKQDVVNINDINTIVEIIENDNTVEINLVEPTIIEICDKTVAVVTETKNKVIEINTGFKGDKGEQGNQGIQGIQGIQAFIS